MAGVLAVSALCAPTAFADGRRPDATSISGTSPNQQCNPAADDREAKAYDGQNRLDMEREPTLAVNPADSNGIAVAWRQDWDDAIAATSSFDGGRSWSAAQYPPGSTHCPPAGPPPPVGTVPDSSINPRLSFGPIAADGSQVLYESALLWDSSGRLPYRVVVNTSMDGGRTWNDAVIVEVGDFAIQVAD